MKKPIAILFFLILAGCGSLPKAGPQAALYDFGIASGTASVNLQHVRLTSVEAAPGLEGSEMRYRLAYKNPAQVLAYTESRWGAPPGKLLQRELEQQLQVSGPAQCILQITVETFDQVFDTPTSSRGVVQLRAVLTKGSGRQAIRQSTLASVEHPATSADAQGGVAALKQGSEEAMAAIVGWARKQDCT